LCNSVGWFSKICFGGTGMRLTGRKFSNGRGNLLKES